MSEKRVILGPTGKVVLTIDRRPVGFQPPKPVARKS